MKKTHNLNEFLKQEISDNGPMPFGAFMAHALCHHEYGYYMTRDPFGVKGDFTTAPEISQMFGEMIGAWVVDIWVQMGRPYKFNLIECGAGRGTLMADILRVSRAVDNFLHAVQITIIETSDLLKEKQRETLGNITVQWHSELSQCAVDEPCIILGNEFLDALPVEQCRFMNGQWQQCHISVENGQFVQTWISPQSDIVAYLPEVKTHAAIYEIAPERINFIEQCTKMIKENGGASLFIDYGYAKLSHGETVQAVKNHEYVPALSDIGECDITAHVDFQTLQESALQGGVLSSPIVTQKDFLKSLGIEHRANALKNTVLKQDGHTQGALKAQGIQNDLDRLIGEKQMGDLFKVMCIYSDDNLKPAGF